MTAPPSLCMAAENEQLVLVLTSKNIEAITRPYNKIKIFKFYFIKLVEKKSVESSGFYFTSFVTFCKFEGYQLYTEKTISCF
jgi:hypothetical protein